MAAITGQSLPFDSLLTEAFNRSFLKWIIFFTGTKSLSYFDVMYQDYLHSVTFILFYLLLYTGPMQGLIFNILFLTCWLHIFFKIIVQHVCFVKGRGMRLRGQKRWNICKLFAIISLPLFPSLRPYVNWERSYATLFIPRVVSPDIYIYIYIYIFFFFNYRILN